MKAEEIRAMSDEQLDAEIIRLRRQVFDLRAQSVTEKLEDITLVTKAKRDIARVLTIRQQREQQAQQLAKS